jgi:integrase
MATRLVKRGNKYSVRVVVPLKYRPIIGKTAIWRTTGTGCKDEAEKRAHGLKAAINHEIDLQVKAAAEARKHTPASREWLLAISADLQSQVASGELNTDTAGEIFSLHLDQHLEALGVSPEDATPEQVRYARSATRAVTSPEYKPLSQAIEEHLEAKAGRIIASTLKRKRGVLEAFDEWAGSPDVASVGRRMAGQYLTEVIMPAELATKTKEWHVSTLATAWRYFERQGLTEVNPWAGFSEDLKDSSRGSATNKKRRIWTPEEIAKLGAIDHADDMYGISLLHLFGVLRTDEAASLRVRDINLEDNFMVVGEAKNQPSIRAIPIHSRILPLVRNLVAGKDPDQYLFDCTSGGRDVPKSANISKRMGRYIRANISEDPKLVWYGLRATAITALERAGVEPLMIQRLAGHSTGKITFDVYSHGPHIEQMREAIEKLDFKV